MIALSTCAQKENYTSKDILNMFCECMSRENQKSKNDDLDIFNSKCSKIFFDEEGDL